MDQILFTGTGASIPNKYANVSGQLLILNGHKFLLDCGESTLLQLLFNDIKIEEIEAVFITHEHADHYLGLASFL